MEFNNKGLSLLELVISAGIMILLIVPATQAMSGAYRAYRSIQNEEAIIESTKLLTAYYQDFYHGETRSIDKNSGDHSGDPLTTFTLADFSLSDISYTRNYIGPATSASPVYYVSPLPALMLPADSYLVAFTITPLTGGSAAMQTACIVSAYYDYQVR